MLTDPVEILKAIIEQDGECESFVNPTVCKNCPLGNKQIDGKRVACSTYINSRHDTRFKSDERIADIYKTEAEEELFTIELESILE